MKRLKNIELSKRIISVIIAGVMLIAGVSALEIKWMFDEFAASAAENELNYNESKQAYEISSYADLVLYSQLYYENPQNY